MYVYSGECRFCKCGRDTTIKSDDGVYLKTGDIVLAYTVTGDFGVVHMSGLTVVVSDDYSNIQGVAPEKREKEGTPFVMGIKSRETDQTVEKYPNDVWRVRKVKDFSDIVDGEKWHDFGFSFRSIH